VVKSLRLSPSHRRRFIADATFDFGIADNSGFVDVLVGEAVGIGYAHGFRIGSGAFVDVANLAPLL
jgi:hypothetical protein